jgi:predicted DNA-binding ribbon-helix-helix protein
MELTKERPRNVKMNLSLDREFYDFLKNKAEDDYIQVATWVKQFLKKNLTEDNKREEKCEMENGSRME